MARCLLLALAMLLLPARSACEPTMTMPANSNRENLSIPHEPNTVALNTGTVPGMLPEAWERFLGQVTVRNVSQATLTPFFPSRSKANGAAVIVLPGGGFYGLSIVSEGSTVARYLAERGIAAFVLKYRLNPTPEKAEEQMVFITAQVMAANNSGGLRFPTPAQSLEDAQAALRMVRVGATRWHIDPRRVGLLGWSPEHQPARRA